MAIMDPLRVVKLSGGQAWDETLRPLTSSTLHFLSNHLWLVAVLLAVTFLFFYLYFSRSSKLLRRNMANGATMNGKPHETSKDFRGNVKVNNNPPTKEQLEKTGNLFVLDADGKSHTFKSLYADNEHGPRRVLIVFIRHFFCGNCQDYLRTLSTSFPPSTLANLTPPTSIAVIGCGQPDMISGYMRETSCAYPIYSDPTRKLYDMLGMIKTLSLGSQAPEYMQRSMFSMAVSSFLQELKSGRKMLSGGDYRQVGGEFLFAEGKVVFCRRMKNTRDHAEISELRRHLGLDRKADDGAGDETTTPAAGRKRWSTSGLGAGLGRRFSSRRRSWAPQRSKSGIGETKESPARSGMQQLKEEEAAVEDSTTPEDALAKLEGKPPTGETAFPKENGTIDTTMNGNAHASANGTAHPIPNEDNLSNDHATNEYAINDTTNGSTNGHITT